MKKGRERNMVPVIVAIVFIIFVLGICIVANQIEKHMPSDKKADLNVYFGFEGDLNGKSKLSMTKKDEVAIVLNNSRAEARGLIIENQVYLPEIFVKEQINSKFYWDEYENILLYTTPTEVIRAQVGSSEYTVGKNKLSAQDSNGAQYTIVRAEGDEVYIAADFVKQYTKMEYQIEKEPNHMRITTRWGEKNMVKATEDTQIRLKKSIKSDILQEVKAETALYVIEQNKKSEWIQVCTKDGRIGFAKKDMFGSVEKVTEEMEFNEPEYTPIHKDETINLVWHQVTTAAANKELSNKISNLKGVNVISPTWISLADNEGNIVSIASSDYVNLAHRVNIEVWALVGKVTADSTDLAQILPYTSKRENLINQLIGEVLKYDIDGINIDFELVSPEIADDYIQFIRELSIRCRINGIVLSVDNYNYVDEGGSSHYNRAAQGEVVDYVINMGYDEHTNSGGESGSVASIGYVRGGIEGTLSEVPAEKVINAIPFYSRLWKETPKTEEELAAEDASSEYIPYHLTSEALGMDTMENRRNAAGVEKVWDEETCQYYFEYEKDGAVYKAWMEDERSIEEKLKLMKEYGLAGVAAWKLGFERNSIWDTIIKYTN